MTAEGEGYPWSDRDVIATMRHLWDWAQRLEARIAKIEAAQPQRVQRWPGMRPDDGRKARHNARGIKLDRATLVLLADYRVHICGSVLGHQREEARSDVADLSRACVFVTQDAGEQSQPIPERGDRVNDSMTILKADYTEARENAKAGAPVRARGASTWRSAERRRSSRKSRR